MKIANPHNNDDSLVQEINYLKKRLYQMGFNGDCAYEKKLAEYFQHVIAQRQEKLSNQNSKN